MKGLLGPRIIRSKKKIARIFKYCGLKIVISSNLHLMNYLGVTLGLRKNTCVSNIKSEPLTAMNNFEKR